MKKVELFIRGKNSGLTLVSLFLVFVFLIQSCNGNADKSKEDDQNKEKMETTTSEVSEKVAPDDATIDLNSLVLSADTLKMIFNKNNNIKELIFQFEYRGADGWGLSVSGTDKKGATITGPISLKIIPGTATPIAPGSVITNQSLRRGDIKRFLNLTGSIGKDKIIEDSNFVSIRITPSPVLGENNAVFFILTKMPSAPVAPYKMSAAGQVITNPCPPAKPCENDCDTPS